MQLGCAASEEFRNAVAALEFPGKPQLQQKIDEFRTRFCAVKSSLLESIPSRSNLAPASMPSRMSIGTSVASLRGVILKRSSFNSLAAALEHLHSKIDSFSLSFTKRKVAKSVANDEVKLFWGIQEIFSMTVFVGDNGDVTVEPYYCGDLEGHIQDRSDRDRAAANTQWEWIMNYLVTELHDVGVGPAKKTFILIGEEKLFSGSTETLVRKLLDKLRVNNRLHRVPIVLKYTLENQEHVREIVTKLQLLEYWKGVFFPLITIVANVVPPSITASGHQTLSNATSFKHPVPHFSLVIDFLVLEIGDMQLEVAMKIFKAVNEEGLLQGDLRVSVQNLVTVLYQRGSLHLLASAIRSTLPTEHADAILNGLQRLQYWNQRFFPVVTAPPDSVVQPRSSNALSTFTQPMVATLPVLVAPAAQVPSARILPGLEALEYGYNVLKMERAKPVFDFATNMQQ